MARPLSQARYDREADHHLVQALDKLMELAARLTAARGLHRPEPARLHLLGAPRPARCGGCGHAFPCPTLRVLDAPIPRAST